ncbi:hypothetical protein UlMin_004703 [Ulmus minor]
MTAIAVAGGSGVIIEEIKEEVETSESPTERMVQSLLGTKLFSNFFNQLDFQNEARKEATEKLLAISQKYGPACYLIGQPFRNITRGQEDMIMFSAKDRQHNYMHNKPLYVEAKINELGKPGPRVCVVSNKEEALELLPEGPKEQTNQLEEVDLSDNPNEPHTVLISKELSGETRKDIIETLRSNKDVFTWTYKEMSGLDPSLVTHKLAVKPAQKPKNGTIRCCIDYRDLNKACPKDEFPLPNIDTLIDATAGHEMFSFMDGFSEYNQIRMAPEDVEKTAFRTTFGNFHYVVMPFRLKNAGATYQRAMTAIFHDMIHDFVEDYVDDLVVKSKKAIYHVSHLKKVFERCRRYNLKMNPKKCAFAVNMGKFLGVVVHREGITIDDTKVAAIKGMSPPRNPD